MYGYLDVGDVVAFQGLLVQKHQLAIAHDSQTVRRVQVTYVLDWLHDMLMSVSDCKPKLNQMRLP